MKIRNDGRQIEIRQAFSASDRLDTGNRSQFMIFLRRVSKWHKYKTKQILLSRILSTTFSVLMKTDTILKPKYQEVTASEVRDGRQLWPNGANSYF